MANSVTIRTTAPGAKDAASDLNSVKTAAGNLGITAKSALGAVGVAAAGGFALATKGALQAQDAQGAFMAATGKSRDEAKAFVSGMDSLAGSAGAVGVSFDKITQVGTTVEQQFGTTGQQTTDLTGKILELAKVSGGDANDQANALGDTLSGMGLDASAAGGVMDNLVASNQQFGTSIGDSITALDNMTPALQAMGLSLGDGQGLLNAFEQANVDASTASGDLTKAIKNLKPGQNIDDLVAQVGAIEDPILRAQKATALFGKSAGPDLAKVIQPGMTSLKDVELQAKDVAGATDKAAEGMETDGQKIQGFLDQLGAGAREAGQEFGPLAMGIGAIGSAAGPVVGQLGGVTTALKAQTLAAKEAAGGWQGLASNVGSVAGPAAIAVAGLYAVNQGLDDVDDKLKTATQGFKDMDPSARAAGASQEILGVKVGNLADGFATLLKNTVPWHSAATDAASAADALNGRLSATDKAADDARESLSLAGAGAIAAAGDFGTAGDTLGESFVHGISEHQDEAASEAAALVVAAQKAMDASASRNANSLSLWALVRQKQEDDAAKAKEIYDKSAQSITGSMADTLQKGAKDEIKDAMDDLTYAITHPLQLAKEQAEVEADLTSKKLLDGLSSNNPEIKAQAEQTKARLIAVWEELTGKAYPEGNDASSDWSAGLSSEYKQAVADARNVANSVNSWLDSIHNNVRVNINVNDPTGQGSTGHGHRAGGGPVQKGVPYIVGEQHEEVFVPDQNGTILPNVPHSPMGTAGGSGPMNIVVKVNLSTRDFATRQKHYATIQQGAPTFR